MEAPIWELGANMIVSPKSHVHLDTTTTLLLLLLLLLNGVRPLSIAPEIVKIL